MVAIFLTPWSAAKLNKPSFVANYYPCLTLIVTISPWIMANTQNTMEAKVDHPPAAEEERSSSLSSWAEGTFNWGGRSHETKYIAELRGIRIIYLRGNKGISSFRLDTPSHSSNESHPTKTISFLLPEISAIIACKFVQPKVCYLSSTRARRNTNFNRFCWTAGPSSPTPTTAAATTTFFQCLACLWYIIILSVIQSGFWRRMKKIIVLGFERKSRVRFRVLLVELLLAYLNDS